MKSTLFNVAVFAFSVVFLSSCAKTPQACIEVTKSVVRAGESISFLSCNDDADSYEWNFGDGNKATGNLASHSFEAQGTYLVQLIAYSKKEKRWDKSQIIISVVPPVKRYLKGFRLNSFNISNLNGQSWDMGAVPLSNPDVFISYGIEASQAFNSTNAVLDLSLNQCPIVWDLSLIGNRIELQNASMFIQLRDFDAAQQSELMHEFTFNPFTSIASVPGEIRLQSANYQLDVLFEEE